MAYTIKTTSSDLYRFPTLETRDEAAKWARQQAKTDIMVVCGGEPNGYFEGFYNDEGDIAGYRVYRRWNHTTRGFTPTAEVATVEIVEL